jgi:hypothetical protein
MPLARIITKSADDSLELSMQLRSRGFRVETVAPDQIPSAPADLEVSLEECAPEEVLMKAAVVQESEDLWVFVAPGALDERSRPMRVIPLTPQVVEFRAPEAATVIPLTPLVEVATAGVKREVESQIPVVEVQAPAVVVKEVILTPEEDPLLCELEAEATVRTTSQVASKVQEIATPVPIAIAEPAAEVQARIKMAEVAPLPIEVKLNAVLAPTEVTVPAPAEAKPKASPRQSLERVKRLAVVQQVASQIPTVPERVEPKIVLYKPAPPKPKRRGPWKSYKVAFQAGPQLWRTASVTFALQVLAGLVATIVAVRPTIPKKGTVVPNPVVFLPVAQVATPVSGAQGVTTAANKPAVSKTNAPNSNSHRRSASDDGVVAKDTVIFYNRKPAPAGEAKLPPREAKLPPPPAPGVKRYSDAN